MKHKRHGSALAVFLVTGLVSVLAAGPATATKIGTGSQRPPAAGSRAPHPTVYFCSGPKHTLRRHCFFQTQEGYTPLFPRRGCKGCFPMLLNLNDRVLITCWYLGNTPPAPPVLGHPWLNDDVQDHTIWHREASVSHDPMTGHIPDPYINEGGKAPWQDPYDLAPCGRG